MPPSRRAEISETLRQRVLHALHFNQLDAGSRLPSARALAGELDADPRVILAAYRALEREGAVERRPPSRAFFVAERGADDAPLPTGEWLVEVLVGSLARGVRAPDFPEHARRGLETLRLRAACLECNTDQLVWLTRELQEDFGVAAVGVDLDELDDGGPDGPGGADGAPGALPAAVRSADLLVTTAAHAERLRPLAERLGRPLVVAAWRSDLVAEVGRLLAAGPVYFVGTDPRFADKLRRELAAMDPAGHARVVLVGRDDVGAIPRGAPTWVMRAARDRLGGLPAHVRALSTLRVLSTATQRAILRYVVRANLAALASRPAAVHLADTTEAR